MTSSGLRLPRRRSSPGGDVVIGSLAATGFERTPSVALVETAPPRLRPHDVVLSQNAWNFVPRDVFRSLADGYTPSRRGLYLARRLVATVNTRRAGTNVALSWHMADLMRAQGLDPRVSPVTLPHELCGAEAAPERAVAGVTTPFVLVPGTLTPYKNAEYAVDLVEMLSTDQRPLVVLAGTDDESGHQTRILDRLRSAGLAHRIGPVTREEMTWLLRRAAATLVPSRLESLSFSLAEALLLSPNVLASPLAVHREVAERLGRQPTWLPERPDLATAHALLQEDGRVPVDVAVFRREWEDLAALLSSRGAA